MLTHTPFTTGAYLAPLALTDVHQQPVQVPSPAHAYTLLLLLRNQQCALCNLHLHRLAAWAANLPEGLLEVVAVFESPADAIRTGLPAERRHPFRLVADPDASLYTYFGATANGEAVRASTARPEVQQAIAEAATLGLTLQHEPGSNFDRLTVDVLVRRDGTVLACHHAGFVTDHLSFSELERLLVS